MKLLLWCSEKLDYQYLGVKLVEGVNPKNFYYLNFKMKLSLFEDQNKDDEFLTNLQEFIEHPERIEMKVLFADKYRRLEKYKKAIKLYSGVIENDSPPSKWNILYSRGISYERLDDWSNAQGFRRSAESSTTRCLYY